MNKLNGIIKAKGNLKSTVNSKVKTNAVVSVGGTLVGAELAKRGLKGEKGDTGDTGATGNGIASVALVSSLGLVDTYEITFTNGTETTFDVTNGADGADGFSPIANVAKVGDTATITVTDEDGTTTATVTDGQDGADGQDGQDGHSPVVTASKVGKATTVSVDGSAIATIDDGADGADGQDGQDGYSPSASVSKVGSTATITITDKDGTTTASVSDGEQNVQSDWNEADNTKDDYIKNKPAIPSATSTTPKMDGTASVGSETMWAKGDHVHPTDTSRASSSHTHTKSDITDFPTLATVATSGDYDDLIDKPSIHNVPSGGTSGQVLSKDSNDDYDLSWITVSGGGSDVVYATSSDSASTVAKTATIVSGTLTTLTSGVQAIVKFADTNTASSPTLNIGSTGAKSIKRYGTTAVGQNKNESWVAGSPVLFVYDGTNWVIAGWLNTTYSGGTSNGIITGTDNLNYIWTPKQIHDGIVGLADENVQSDWDQADTTADDYIKNKPTIPTVNNATLTIQKNGTTVDSFTANASSNVTANISVPTNTSDLNNDSGFITSSNLVDMFYPVGSYYETSDTSFDPNITWGGTWVLETEGQVHVSAGTNYTAGDTGGSKDAIIPYHNHGFTQPTISSHTHPAADGKGFLEYDGNITITSKRAYTTANSSGAIYIVASDNPGITRNTATGTRQPTASGGAVKYAGTSGNTTNANMQPYIVVNRWHRTA